MSDQQNLTDLLEEITAVSDENVLYCDIPYNVFISEAEGLHTRATLDLPLLQDFNFDAAKLDRLLVCTGALRTAQSNWEAKKTAKAMALENWKKEAPAMYALHDDLIDNMEFAFRAEDSLLAKLAEIKEGDSNADTVQDMASLSVLGKENPDLLTAINFDLTQLDTAAEIADRMGTLLGEINGRMYFEDDIKLIRDKAYTLTKAVVDEVRSYGKFVFRKNEEKRRAYASKYNRNRQAEYRRSKAEEDYELN
ncbi:hypothetical protein ACT3CE_15820 [Marinifilum sp. RC60d5]|uniref:hypothetical protein n=1 Tax=Marinifilum sp. RC60d5 TaxID=3458414 RepID=UPI0040369455